MAKVLDASALMAYLGREDGYEHVRDLFIKAAGADRNLLMTTVNWGEVYYLLIRDYGHQEAEQIRSLIDTFPVEFVPADIELTKQAAVYKAEKKLPFVDCFAAALAKRRKAELVTADKDFKVVEGEIKIVWIV